MGVTKNKVFVLLLTVMLTFGVMLSSASASSTQSTETATAELEKQRGDFLNQFLADLYGKKKRIKALENQLVHVADVGISNSEGSTQVASISNELKSLKADVAYKEDNIEEITGLIEVDPKESGLIMPLGDGQVSFNGTMYYDSLFTDHWLAKAEYEWVDREYTNQITGSGDVGGYEGFTVGLNRQVVTYSTSAYVYDFYEGVVQDDVQFYQEYSNYGRGWKWQDVLFPGSVENYNSHSGIFSLYFEFVTEPDEDSVTQHYGTYAHTWDETAVNSIGVGPYSASIGWTNEGHQWSDSDQWVTQH